MALIDCTGKQFSYDDLHAAIRSLTGLFRTLHLGSGSKIVLHLEKSFASVASIHAAQDIGAAYIPIDPSAPEPRVRQIMTDAQAHVVIHDRPDLFPGTTSDKCSIPGMENVHITTLLKPNYDATDAVANYFPKRMAYVLYTSGSTGAPKGVCVSSEAANAFASWCVETFGITHRDHIASIAPFHFDLSVCDLFASRDVKATVHLFRDEQVQNVRQMGKELSERKITFIYATPTFYSALVQYGKIEKYDWSALRVVLFAGEVFPVKQLHALMSVWSEAEFYNLYGPTETNVCTYTEIVKDEGRTEPYPIGLPCSEHELEITSDGELLVGGAHVAEGYLNQPELTAEKFFSRNGVRWFRTGDRVVLDEHHQLVFRGRMDRMVKRRGYRIEPGEIEAALYRVNGITDAAVVTAHRGDEVQLVAVITSDGSRAHEIIELKKELLLLLPDYMLPDAVVTVNAFPKTSSGKTDYVKLQQEVVPSL